MARLDDAAIYRVPEPTFGEAGCGGESGRMKHGRDGLALHQQAVGALAGGLARVLGWTAEHALQLQEAAALHDMGKRFIDPQVVRKPGPLSDDERALMQLHPELCWLHLRSVPPSPVIDLAAQIALEHHERWDGAGYPARKCGDTIGLPSRITSLCDAYAARRERRPYKAESSHDEALAVLIAGEAPGSQAFDPALLAAFSANEPCMERIFDLHAALSTGASARTLPQQDTDDHAARHDNR